MYIDKFYAQIQINGDYLFIYIVFLNIIQVNIFVYIKIPLSVEMLTYIKRGFDFKAYYFVKFKYFIFKWYSNIIFGVKSIFVDRDIFLIKNNNFNINVYYFLICKYSFFLDLNVRILDINMKTLNLNIILNDLNITKYILRSDYLLINKYKNLIFKYYFIY